MMRRILLTLVLAVVAAAACLDDVVAPAPAPPEVPALAGVPERTGSRVVVVRGTRAANTSLLLERDGEVAEVIARSRVTAFRLPIALEPGPNTFALSAADAAGRTSASVSVSVFFDESLPAAPRLEEVPRTVREVAVIAGEKDEGCELRENGVILTEVRAGDRRVTLQRFVSLGANDFRFACANDEGIESDVVTVTASRLVEVPFNLCFGPPPAQGAPCLPLPAEVSTDTIEISGVCDDDVLVRVGAEGAITACVDGRWAGVTLPVPANVVVFAAFQGEFEDQAQDFDVNVAFVEPAGEGEGEGEAGQ